MSSDFMTASQPIVGKVERHPGALLRTPGRSGIETRDGHKNPRSRPGILGGAMSQSDRFCRQLPIGPEHAANASHGLTNAVLVLDQRETHMIVAILAKTDAW